MTGLCEGNHRSPVDSRHKGQVAWKRFPFDDIIMCFFNPQIHTSLVNGRPGADGPSQELQVSGVKNECEIELEVLKIDICDLVMILYLVN